jgi:malonyl-CoA O-methyltransferase
MQSAYEAFRCDGRLPATYEVVFGQAWTPAAPRARKGTTAEIPMADLRRQLEQRRRPGGAS